MYSFAKTSATVYRFWMRDRDVLEKKGREVDFFGLISLH